MFSGYCKQLLAPVTVDISWFQFSSDKPVLTEISTVTGANNLIVLGLRRWFGVVDQ
jgi:hypothetical protein